MGFARWIPALLTAAATLQSPAPVPKEVLAWMKDSSISVRTVEAGSGFSDLESLRPLLVDKRVVALGEATHGTREFFQFKHRMLEFLVEELGFNVFAIEANFSESLDINEYISGGNGNPEKALAGLYFWTWNTEEVLEMLRWMRSYNADPAHTRKVKFYGFDMQSPVRSLKLVLGYLRQKDPAISDSLAGRLSILMDPFTAKTTFDFDSAGKALLLAAAGDLMKALDAHAEPTSGWKMVRQHGRLVQQFIELLSAMPTGWTVRDRFMSENVQWILDHEGPDCKMVIWGHNYHVSKSPGGEKGTMGSYLAQALGKRIWILGFAFNQGGFQSVEMPSEAGGGLRAFTVPPAPGGTFDAALAEAGLRCAILPLSPTPNKVVADWLSAEQKTREIAAGYEPDYADEYFDKQKLAEKYDAVFFVEKTTAARPNPSTYRFPGAALKAPANLNFEHEAAGNSVPGWFVQETSVRGFDYQVQIVRNAIEGCCAVRISRDPGTHYGEGYGGIQQRVEASPFRKSPLCVSAFVRSESMEPGSAAHLWMKISGQPYPAPAIDRFVAAALSHEWQRYQVRETVPEDAVSIEYGVAFAGNGSITVDDFRVDNCPQR